MINVRNLSVFLFSFVYCFGATAGEVTHYPGFESSLQRFNTYKIENLPCPLTINPYSCPKILSDLAKDDDSDRALGLVKANVQHCRMPLQVKDNQVNFDLLKDPPSLQKSFSKNSYLDVGPYSNSTAAACSYLPPSQGVAVLSKFYYYSKRLNEASKKATQESFLISRLLGKPAPACPSSDTLNSAAELCKQVQACPQTTKLSQLAVNAVADEKIYLEYVDKISKLPKNCDETSECKKQKQAFSTIVVGLIEKNPWFLNSDFRKSKKPMVDRLTKYLEDSQTSLLEQQSKIQLASSCIHGSRNYNCDMDKLRETLSNTPEAASPRSIRKDDNLTSKLLSVQSCVEEWSLEKNRVGKVMTDFYWDAGLTIATLGLGAVAKGGLTGTTQLVKLMGFGAEAVNFSLDLYNFGKGLKDAIDVCNSVGQASLTQGTKKNVCDAGGSALNPTTSDHGSCLIQAGFAAIGLGVTVASAARIGKIVAGPTAEAVAAATTAKNEAAVAKAAAVEAEAAAANAKIKKRADDIAKPKTETRGPLARSTVAEAKEIVKPLESHPMIANKPEGIVLSEVEQANGTKKIMYDVAEKLEDGTFVRASGEIPIDPATGAINANFSTGRRFFELLTKLKAGKSFFAFIDVGSLGAVNKFKAGTEAGDKYLKAVADAILKAGKGKVTLARLGGDEFGVIIDSVDPAEIKRIQLAIQEEIRSVSGDAHQVFRDQKIELAKQYRQAADELTVDGIPLTKKDKALLRQDIDELAKIQQPDVSMGARQIGHGETLADIQQVAEEQAKQMKIQTALNFGRSAAKYGSKEAPNARVNPIYTAPIEDAMTSPYWVRSVPAPDVAPALTSLRAMAVTPVEEVKRFGNATLLRSQDELGRDVYTVEHYLKDASGTTKITSEIPTNSATGLLDARHPEMQKLIAEHIQSSPDTVAIMPKLTSLKYLNYFDDGSAVGDKMLALAADIMKKDMRSSDLIAKLGGADFIWSVNKGVADNIDKISKKINQDIMNSPVFKEIIEKERSIILTKIDELKSNALKQLSSAPAAAAEILKLKEKLKAVDNFKPDLNFQTASHKEVQNLEFKDIEKLLDDKHKAARDAAEAIGKQK